jgi:ABC-type sugar transport system ATPase subunit
VPQRGLSIPCSAAYGLPETKRTLQGEEQGNGQGRVGSEAMVRFVNVQKSYDGETLVVKNLNLDIAKGEFLTMLGPSGSGKTTTLMMLAGFEPATMARSILKGKPINNVPPHKRGIGMVFQNYALFPHMTVNENLAFPLQVRNMAKAEREDRVKKSSTWCSCRRWAIAAPASSPAASSSASRWPAPWCSNPTSC